MALQKSIALLKQYVAIKDGIINDEDVQQLLIPGHFTASGGNFSSKKPVDDSNHQRLDVMRDFVKNIGVFLTAETLHQLTDRLIALAPKCSKNNFMRSETIEKYFLAYEMARQPELAEQHFNSERMKEEFPGDNDIQKLKIVMLQINIEFFQDQTPQLKQLVKLCVEYQQHLKKSTGEFDKEYIARDDLKAQPPHVNLALKKYNIVQEMMDKLKDVKFDSAQRIKNMSDLLSTENKQCLQGHRNSSFGARFLENLLHIITLGIYSKASKNSFAFWKSHGEVFCDTIETQNNSKPK